MRHACTLLLMLTVWPAMAAEKDTAAALFDGKSFAGWEGNLKHFRIEQGAIVAGSRQGKVPRT